MDVWIRQRALHFIPYGMSVMARGPLAIILAARNTSPMPRSFSARPVFNPPTRRSA